MYKKKKLQGFESYNQTKPNNPVFKC